MGPAAVGSQRTTEALDLDPDEVIVHAAVLKMGVVPGFPTLCGPYSTDRCVVGLEVTTNKGRRCVRGAGAAVRGTYAEGAGASPAGTRGTK